MLFRPNRWIRFLVLVLGIVLLIVSLGLIATYRETFWRFGRIGLSEKDVWKLIDLGKEKGDLTGMQMSSSDLRALKLAQYRMPLFALSHLMLAWFILTSVVKMHDIGWNVRLFRRGIFSIIFGFILYCNCEPLTKAAIIDSYGKVYFRVLAVAGALLVIVGVGFILKGILKKFRG